MLFRRLSSYFNLMMGEPARLSGTDRFYGFYLNARHIAEAFPWLPADKEEDAAAQVVSNFNLSWALEILNWLQALSKTNPFDVSFLNSFFRKFYPGYFSAGSNSSIYYLLDFIRAEIDKSRLRSTYEAKNWPLLNYDFLDSLVQAIKVAGIVPEKPFYFFLDDYSLPMVKSTVQRILNPIIFRRSAHVIFKVSTESSASFEAQSLNGKMLEENDDYKLIDCGVLALGENSDEKCKDILFSILKQRIERHPLLQGRQLTLERLLGKTTLNDEQRAQLIKEGANSQPLYQGWSVFCDMWSSDIREMIKLFAAMITKETESKLQAESNQIISDKVQNEVYVEAGGQFMALLSAATNPSERSDGSENYAINLIEIVKAFHGAASFDLKTKHSKNLDKNPIRKARRIEIADIEDALPPEALDYYKGLIRYGIFIQDNRGKSIRGKVVPMLYLRSLLIPYFKLAFSKRDHVHMPWDKFLKFLLTPKEYLREYTTPSKKDSQPQITLPGIEV